jgi:PPOX class probable F420-dependent enzyme
MSAFDAQKRGRRIAMSETEVDAYLGVERTCRVATVKASGAPHVTPLWFLWHNRELWLTTLTKSQRWTDLERDPHVSVVVDSGDGYMELCGVELSGRVEVVGEVPRVGEPNAELDEIERLNALKYQGPNGSVRHDGRHAWVRLRPDRIVSWDFRKIKSI